MFVSFWHVCSVVLTVILSSKLGKTYVTLSAEPRGVQTSTSPACVAATSVISSVPADHTTLSSVLPNSCGLRSRSALRPRCPVTRDSTACHKPKQRVPARGDNKTSSRLNRLHPIGPRSAIRCRTHILTGCITLAVPHGTSQLSPHFKRNRTPHPGTAWLDVTTRIVTEVPLLLTSLYWQLLPLVFSKLLLQIACFFAHVVEVHTLVQPNRFPLRAPPLRR